MSEIGFKIRGRFFPWVRLDSWKQKDSRAARRVAGCTIRELLSANQDNVTVNFAFAAVAWWHGNPAASEDDVANFIDDLTAADLELIGFESLGEDEASPPVETPGPEPSESTEPSSESTQETSPPKSSGTPSLPGDSTSGRQTLSES